MKPYIITIERQYGSGGKTVGKMLAKKLNIPFYNREIVTMASEESGINPVLFRLRRAAQARSDGATAQPRQ